MPNASALTKDQPRYWPCDVCGAEAGGLCRTSTGNPAPSHMARHRSADRWQRYFAEQAAQQARQAARKAYRDDLLSVPCDGSESGGCNAFRGEMCYTRWSGSSVADGHMYRKGIAEALPYYRTLPSNPEIDALLSTLVEPGDGVITLWKLILSVTNSAKRAAR